MGLKERCSCCGVWFQVPSRDFTLHLKWCQPVSLEGVDGGKRRGNGNNATYSSQKEMKKLKRRLDFASGLHAMRTKKQRSPATANAVQDDVLTNERVDDLNTDITVQRLRKDIVRNNRLCSPLRIVTEGTELPSNVGGSASMHCERATANNEPVDEHDVSRRNKSGAPISSGKECTITDRTQHLPSQVFQIELNDILQRHNCSHKCHDELVKLINSSLKDGKLQKANGDMVKRTTFMRRLEKKYKTEGLRPEDVEVTLSGGKSCTVSVFDVKAMILSLLKDEALMHPDNLAKGYDMLTGLPQPCHPANLRYGEIHTGDAWLPALQRFVGWQEIWARKQAILGDGRGTGKVPLPQPN